MGGAKKASAKGGSFNSWLRASAKQRARMKATFKPKTAFVIMAFKGRQKTYLAIKDECRRHRVNVFRADEGADSGLVIQEIFDRIEEAEFVICDLTGGRPNVYYELGYAHGVGNSPDNILLLAKSGTDLHFDIAPLQVKRYRSLEELRSVVAARLKAWLRPSAKKR